MSDVEIDALNETRDLGLAEPDMNGVSSTVSAALEREYEAERSRGGVQRKAGKRRRSKRFAVAACVTVLVGGVATVGYAALTGSSTASDGIGCHVGEEIGGSATIVGLDGRRATKTCAELWTAGEVVAGAEKAPAPLHACVAGDGGGSIHVFSSADASICDRVGLVENPDAGLDPDARRFGEFESQLMAILERTARQRFVCTGQEQMRGLVERLLAEHKLKGWAIEESGTFDQTNRCATLGLESDARTVTLFPMRP